MTTKLFDVLNNIFYKNEKYVYNKKDCNAYMLSQWLSHDNKLCDIVNDINQFQFLLNDDIIYQYYYNKVPKGKRFIKWTKKDKINKKRQLIINQLAKKHECSIIEIEKSLIKGN